MSVIMSQHEKQLNNHFYNLSSCIVDVADSMRELYICHIITTFTFNLYKKIVQNLCFLNKTIYE
jgi:hypothetical protein